MMCHKAEAELMVVSGRHFCNLRNCIAIRYSARQSSAIVFWDVISIASNVLIVCNTGNGPTRGWYFEIIATEKSLMKTIRIPS